MEGSKLASAVKGFVTPRTAAIATRQQQQQQQPKRQPRRL